MEKKYKVYRIKIAFVGLMFVFFFCVVTLRSYQLQIQGSSKLNHLAQSQYRTKLVENPKRGAIYDRNGEVLALDVLVSSVAIHPHAITDKKKAMALIGKYTDTSKELLHKKFYSKRRFEWIQRRIPKEFGKKISEKKLKGVQVVKEYRRFYPGKSLGGQLLGAVGYDAKALGGVESSFDAYLKSGTTKKNAERDARGRLFSPLVNSESNHDIFLTIDKNIQYYAEKYLSEYGKKHDVKSGFAVVANVDSGEILAMANYPSFNPNIYWKYQQSFWKNHAITDVFEPGSTFKAVLMGAALNTGKVEAKSRFNCEGGRYRVDDFVISDHGAGYGWMSANDILKVSSNIGVTKIATKIGRKSFNDFIKSSGFREGSGIRLGGELLGYMKSYKTWKDIEFSNIAFGQGISVNGLQMVRAYTAFANGGRLKKLAILKSIRAPNGKSVYEHEIKEGEKILEESKSQSLVEMLHGVTQPGGTATQAHVEGYHSAGKTGTAQKFDNSLKSYAKDEYVSSFIGMVPYDDPKFVIYVVYDTPRKNGYYGGVVAGPVFKNVAEKTLKYYAMVPKFLKDEKLTSKKLIKEDSDKEEDLKLNKRESDVVREKRIEEIQQTLAKNLVPDFRGLTIRKVMEVMDSHSISLKVTGTGVVVEQSPSPGMSLNKNKQWKFELEQRS